MGTEQNSEKFNEFALAFLKEAKDDIEAAEILFEKVKYSKVVASCQQCVEKSVKALLEMEKIFLPEHDLSQPFVIFIYENKNYSEFKPNIEIILTNLSYFSGEWKKTRYPKEKNGKVFAPLELYDKEMAKESIDRAQETYENIKEILNKKFKLRE